MSDPMPPHTGARLPVPVEGLPEGVRALSVPRPGPAGPRVPLDRRRRFAPRQVDLVAWAPPAEVRPPNGINDQDVRWVLAARSRRWPSIQGRFGTRALEVALDLVRAGAIALRCEVREGYKLGSPRGWRLSAPWASHAEARHTTRQQHAARWRERARAAAAAIEQLDPGLATSLHAARGNEPRLPVLVYAAEDLTAGVSHDGPRAFSQAHFTDTKAREDVAVILLDASASEASLLALGLRRSSYLGLGGPVTLHTAGDVLDLGALDGPVRFRADQRTPVTAATTAVTMLVVENLQAAETACDTYPDLAVAWTAGQPAEPALRLIIHLADQVEHVLIITDADLGGVRIAQRILAALNHPESAHVIDVGAQPHIKRAPFGPDSMASLQAAARDNRVGVLATACLTRGYPVEQEAATRAAVDRALRRL
jgi:Protein of unknown function C-terminus (DUF2399)